MAGAIAFTGIFAIDEENAWVCGTGGDIQKYGDTIIECDPFIPTVTSRKLLEDGDYKLLEDGSYKLLE